MLLTALALLSIESVSTRLSQAWVGTSRVVRWLCTILSLVLLIVLVRAIVLPRPASAAFTPPAGGE
jgi:hypothetical protein